MRYDTFMRKLKYIFLPLVIIMLLSLGCQKQSPANEPSGNYNVPMRLGNQTIFIEIAKTPTAQAQGLSGRNKLTDTEGMLFQFSSSQSQNPGFWMKDMKFDLDFIWIKNKQIIGITKNVAHPASNDEKLNTYYPPSPVDSVLEVNAGWSDSHNISVGNAVNLQN